MIVDFHGFSKARLISGDRGLSWEPPVFRQVTSITPGSSWSTSVLPVSKATPWALLDKIPTGRRKNSTGSMKTQPLRIPIDERLCRFMFFFWNLCHQFMGFQSWSALQVPQFRGLSLYPISLLSFTGGNLWWPIQQLRNASATLAWDSWYKTFSQLLQNIPNT